MSTPLNYGNEYAFHYVLTVGDEDFGTWEGDGIEWPVESSTVTDPQFGEEPNGGRQTSAEVDLSRPYRRSGRPTFGSDGVVLQRLTDLGGKRQVTLKQYELDDDGLRQSPPLGVFPGTLGKCKGPNAKSDGNDAGRIEVTVQVKRR